MSGRHQRVNGQPAMKWDNTERYLSASITFADGAFESVGVLEHLAQTVTIDSSRAVANRVNSQKHLGA